MIAVPYHTFMRCVSFLRTVSRTVSQYHTSVPTRMLLKRIKESQESTVEAEEHDDTVVLSYIMIRVGLQARFFSWGSKGDLKKAFHRKRGFNTHPPHRPKLPNPQIYYKQQPATSDTSDPEHTSSSSFTGSGLARALPCSSRPLCCNNSHAGPSARTSTVCKTSPRAGSARRAPVPPSCPRSA